jgi:hypothetical protein
VYRVKDMYFHVNEKSNLKAPLIADDVYDIIMKVRDLGCIIVFLDVVMMCELSMVEIRVLIEFK